MKEGYNKRERYGKSESMKEKYIERERERVHEIERFSKSDSVREKDIVTIRECERMIQ